MPIPRSFLHHRRTIITLPLPSYDLLTASRRAFTPSAMSSPALQSVSEDEDLEDMGYFNRRALIDSPVPDSPPELSSDGEESDSTLDDVDIFGKIGHPLARVPRRTSFDVIITPESDQESGHGAIYHPGTACSSCCSSRSASSSSLTSTPTDYQAIVDDLLNVRNNPFDQLDPQNFVTYDPIPSVLSPSPPSTPPLMIKRIPRDSSEIPLLLELNSSEPRKDPWNPSPHIIQVVDQDPKSDYLYVCMERLSEYNVPPMTTVSQYIDFFRQILEGLSFLHEHRVVGMSCSDPASYMVDLSSASYSDNTSLTALQPGITTSQDPGIPTPLRVHSSRRSRSHHRHHHHHLPLAPPVQLFDRYMYPVRYYLVNFSHARRISADTPVRDRTPIPSHSKYPIPPRQLCPLTQDVQEMGTLIDQMLADVPNVVSTKFKALIKAMTVGGFGAEDSRKLFEALCRSLEASVFEMSVRSGARRSQSVDIPVPGGGGSSCASSIKGDFGIEPEKVALSS